MNTIRGMEISRRSFIKRAAVGVFGLSTLGVLRGPLAWARGQEAGLPTPQPVPAGYGTLFPTADQNGDEILALPKNFRYATFGKIGTPMTGGGVTPCNPDGMAAFPGPGGTIRLIRNHEVRNKPGQTQGVVGGPAFTKYDPLGVGGCVTLDYDPASGKVVRDFVSLNGTLVNCAGGYAFQDAAWISGEETVAGPAQGWARKHGYNFLVSATTNGAAVAIPLTAMGRFKHEAAVAAAESGIVYQTEDAGTGVGSGFYRFVPDRAADLAKGGRLQMLAIRGKPQFDARQGQRVDHKLAVEWIDIPNPDPDLEGGATGVFAQGYARGGCRFNRLEGLWRGANGGVFFSSTSGGNAKNRDTNADHYRGGYGQIWHYIPSAAEDTLCLVFESPGQGVLDSPDNICITPAGGLLICEDDAGFQDQDTHPLAPGITDVNRLIGLTRAGGPFEFAVNRLNNSEFAGACFDPSGHTLFVNIYGNGLPGSGMTCAITGPWRAGPL